MDILGTISPSLISKLEQIKQYMAKRRVTAFIGAGFSLNAEMPSHVKMKTWTQLREDFLDKLYGDNAVAKKEDVNDVVQLASLIDAEFKRNELDEILEAALPDKLIRPGKLHRMLVRLKWRDILTTNYDTLIERAAEEEIQEYQLVTNKETLLYQPSPRIIKLHGSFPNIRPYIMTKEDYRKYPMEHPEMVNTARQCFLESLMCLIGFSGDDPNFQSWLGWLRDVIGRDRICPTYLVTFKKGFHDAEKSLMAQLGIDIINLAEIPGIKDFKEAYSFFFEYLQTSQVCMEWSGRVDTFAYHLEKGKEVEGIKNLTDVLGEIRQRYPGWMALPVKYYEQFRDANENILFLGRYFNIVPDEWYLKLQFLYELDWRLSVSCTPKSIEWFVPTIETVIEHIDSPNEEERKMISQLRLSLLQLYRLNHDKEKFDNLCAILLADSMNISIGAVKYQQILYAQTLLDYKAIQAYLTEWETDYGNYTDSIHKASVLVMMNNKRDAFDILDKCRLELSRTLVNRGYDAYSNSCLVYVLELLAYCSDGVSQRIPEHLRQGLTIEDFNVYCCKKAYERQPEQGFKVVHNFKIGSYSNSWSSGRSGFIPDYLYPQRWFAFKEVVGMAFNVIDEKFYLYCVDKMFDYDWHLAMDKLLAVSSSKFAKETITRKHLSQISRDDANEFFDSYIGYVERYDDIANPLQKRIIRYNLTHILGRMCCVISEDRILRYVKAVISFDVHLVCEVLDFIYDSISTDKLSEIVPLILARQEIKTPYEFGVNLPSNRKVSFPVDESLLSKICNGFASDVVNEQSKAYKLTCLLWKNDLLNNDEKTRLEGALRKWRAKGNSSDMLYSYNLVKPDEEETEKLNLYIKEDVDDFCNENYIYDGSSLPLSDWANKLERLCIHNHRLTEEQAVRVFEHIADMLHKNVDTFIKDSSEDEIFFGGIKTIVNSIMLYVSEFFCCHAWNFVRNDYWGIFCEDLERLLEKGYRCLPMLVWLNTGTDDLKMSYDIREKLKKSLFSKEESLRGQTVSAILFALKMENDIKDILDHMFSVLKVINDVRVVDSLMLIESLLLQGYDGDSDFAKKVELLLIKIHDEVNNYELNADELTELGYHANFIAGVASAKYKDTKFLLPLKFPYFTLEEAGFNDVFLGYERGKEKAEEKVDC